jgi:Kef-type K+ transport system membrane component KefB
MDISLLAIFIVPALVLILVSIAAKFFTVFLSSRMQGVSMRTSLRTGFGLSSSGGELALVVAKGGVDVGVTSSFILPMVGSMTIVTTFITPYMVKIGWKVADALGSLPSNNNNKKIWWRLGLFNFFKREGEQKRRRITNNRIGRIKNICSTNLYYVTRLLCGYYAYKHSIWIIILILTGIST